MSLADTFLLEPMEGDDVHELSALEASMVLDDASGTADVDELEALMAGARAPRAQSAPSDGVAPGPAQGAAPGPARVAAPRPVAQLIMAKPMGAYKSL